VTIPDRDSKITIDGNIWQYSNNRWFYQPKNCHDEDKYKDQIIIKHRIPIKPFKYKYIYINIKRHALKHIGLFKKKCIEHLDNGKDVESFKMYVIKLVDDAIHHGYVKNIYNYLSKDTEQVEQDMYDRNPNPPLIITPFNAMKALNEQNNDQDIRIKYKDYCIVGRWNTKDKIYTVYTISKCNEHFKLEYSILY